MIKRALNTINKEGFAEIHVADTVAYIHMIDCQKQVQQRHNAELVDKALQAAEEY